MINLEGFINLINTHLVSFWFLYFFLQVPVCKFVQLQVFSSSLADGVEKSLVRGNNLLVNITSLLVIVSVNGVCASHLDHHRRCHHGTNTKYIEPVAKQLILNIDC